MSGFATSIGKNGSTGSKKIGGLARRKAAKE